LGESSVPEKDESTKKYTQELLDYYQQNPQMAQKLFNSPLRQQYANYFENNNA